MGDYPDRQRSAAHGNSDSDNLLKTVHMQD